MTLNDLKMKKTELIFLIISITPFLTSSKAKNKNNNSGRCSTLPKQCRFVKYMRYSETQNDKTTLYQDGLICENKFDEKMLRALGKAWKNCPSLSEMNLTVSVKSSSHRQIVDKSFGVFKLTNYTKNQKYLINLKFLRTRGFDIVSQIRLKNFKRITFYSDFNLYKKQNLIKSCDDFVGSNSTGFIFQPSVAHFRIFKPKSSYPICSLFFRHARIRFFEIHYLVNSFFLKNKISFTSSHLNHSNKPERQLNSTILNFYFEYCYGLDIDSRLLNWEIFFYTQKIYFNGHVNSIEINVFKLVRNLFYIGFNPAYFMQLIRKQGIAWIKSINADLRVDIANSSDVVKNYDNIVEIYCQITRDYLLNTNIQVAYDKDFCLFIDFPFEQMIFFIIENDFKISYLGSRTYLSCTMLWLFQHYRKVGFLFSYFEKKKLNAENFTNCNFEKRIQLCNKSNFRVIKVDEPSSTKFSFLDLMVLFELFLIFGEVILGDFGIIANVITIYVIMHKKNVKTMSDKHYKYMCLHCVSNASICFIQILNLISECQFPFGLFCSSIRQIIAIQYIHIVFGEYFNCVFRLISNFTYLGFSLCRMYKVGKEHRKLVVFMDQLNIKKYMIACVFVSAGLTVCKALQFDINIDYPEFASPLPFIQNPSRFRWMFKPGNVAITAINGFYDMINYFVFIIIHLIVDIILFKKMRKVLKEKEEKMKEMKSQGFEKAQKESQESRQRLVSMVIFSSVFNFLTKVPSMITSINDLRLLILKPDGQLTRLIQFFLFNPNPTFLSFRFFCSTKRSCLIFRKFANCLFLISLSSPLFFLKRFDKNFQEAYQVAFTKIEKKDKPFDLPRNSIPNFVISKLVEERNKKN